MCWFTSPLMDKCFWELSYLLWPCCYCGLGVEAGPKKSNKPTVNVRWAQSKCGFWKWMEAVATSLSTKPARKRTLTMLPRRGTHHSWVLIKSWLRFLKGVLNGSHKFLLADSCTWSGCTDLCSSGLQWTDCCRSDPRQNSQGKGVALQYTKQNQCKSRFCANKICK